MVIGGGPGGGGAGVGGGGAGGWAGAAAGLGGGAVARGVGAAVGLGVAGRGGGGGGGGGGVGGGGPAASGVGGGAATAAAAGLAVCCRSSDQPPPRKAPRLTRTSATDATSLVDGRLPRRGSPSIRGRLCQKVQLRCRPAPRVTSDERWQLLDEQAARRRPRRATYRRRRWLLRSPAVQLSNELPRGNYPVRSYWEMGGWRS